MQDKNEKMIGTNCKKNWIFEGFWEGFWEENRGNILGENPSEVVNKTI